MIRSATRSTALALSLALAPLSAAAQDRPGPVSIETGIGFTSDPTDFLLAAELPIEVARDVEVGPLIQLGFGDDRLLVAPTVNARYSFLLSRYVTNPNPIWDRLRPLAHGGVGIAYIERDLPGNNPDDLGFLFNVGVGMLYEQSDRLAFGTRMTFNVMPDEVLGDHFFFSWQLGQVRYRF